MEEEQPADMVEFPDWGRRRNDASVTDCVTPQDECFREEEDSSWSDISEPSPEAWVADQSLYCEDKAPAMSDPSPLATYYEPEDWDAEMLEIESPYGNSALSQLMMIPKVSLPLLFSAPIAKGYLMKMLKPSTCLPTKDPHHRHQKLLFVNCSIQGWTGAPRQP
ncbi:coordinator of PRMT5 and differentiation stimulator isoform X1 [Dendrobates tinctorius]|uniref:coordinator of PRMT5 and differentiation stimulator isoform X1 n=1 Tax=Dendrobates tinctorius TaxID=92724 RepID=UPI003CCA0F04